MLSQEDNSTSVVIDVPSTRIVQKEDEKKYVIYLISIECRKNGLNSPEAVTFERRYSDFSNLYVMLKNRYPDALANIQFPRKQLFGNFTDETALARKNLFKNFLNSILLAEDIFQSKEFVWFLQSNELESVKRFVKAEQYEEAFVILERLCALFNRLYTIRNPHNVNMLCLAVACGSAAKMERTTHYAKLALSRFQGICDIDLLKYYKPLLRLCSTLRLNSVDEQFIQKELASMGRLGTPGSDASLLDITMEYFANSIYNSDNVK